MPKDVSKTRARYWVFTVNNWTEEEKQSILDNTEHIRYVCFGEETGDSGTRHLQGYVQFWKQLRLTAVKGMPGLGRAHLEPARGTVADNQKYCSKQAELQERGTPGSGGKRTDLDDIKAMIRDGATDEQIADSHFGSWCRYRSAFREYRLLIRPKNEARDIKIVVYYGPSGTGKTTTVAKRFPDAYWRTNDGTLWWDGYEGQKVIVIDEFYGWLKYDFMLRVCDWQPVTLPVRGANVPCCADTIVFTSNVHPHLWWKNVSDTHAWERRLREFGEVIHLESRSD